VQKTVLRMQVGQAEQLGTGVSL
jgi:hypothetical protein